MAFRIFWRAVAGAFSALALSGSALAQPPVPGSTHTFLDPDFKGTVFCDTLAEVQRIASSPAPADAYAGFTMIANERNEPACMAIVPTGTVRGITPLGALMMNGNHYRAWAIETDVDGTVAYALYLERMRYAGA